jgi:hypothetical protein
LSKRVLVNHDLCPETRCGDLFEVELWELQKDAKGADIEKGLSSKDELGEKQKAQNFDDRSDGFLTKGKKLVLLGHVIHQKCWCADGWVECACP